MAGGRADDEVSIDVVVGTLDDEVTKRLLAGAAERYEDVMRAVRLAAAGDGKRLAVL